MYFAYIGARKFVKSKQKSSLRFSSQTASKIIQLGPTTQLTIVPRLAANAGLRFGIAPILGTDGGEGAIRQQLHRGCAIYFFHMLTLLPSAEWAQYATD